MKIEQKFLLLFLILLIGACEKKISFYEETFFSYDTIVTIIIERTQKREKIIKNIKKLLKKYDLIFNINNPESEIYKLKNYKTNKTYHISKDLYEVLKLSKRIYIESNRLFDPTVGIITSLYKFDQKEHNSLPDIKRYLNYVGFSNIILKDNGTIIFKKKNMIIDTGAISKGYIIDRISEYIKKEGVKNFLVNIGGDIYSYGKNGDNRKWIVGVQHPLKHNSIILKLSLFNEAIATSGDYERFFYYQGKRYFHILNPFTGLPAFGNIVSVTVISKNAVLADALSTTIFLLGEKKAKKFMEKFYPDIKYIIIKKINNELYIKKYNIK